jgi:hypothetical protein
MRTNCPICGKKSIDQFQMKYTVPDGWELPGIYFVKIRRQKEQSNDL